MKIRLAIPSYGDREKLIGLLGLNGYPTIAVIIKPDTLWGDIKGIEIDVPEPKEPKEAKDGSTV